MMDTPVTNSTQPQPHASRWWHGVPLAVGLAFVLLLASFGRIAGDTQSALFHDNVLDSVLGGQVWGTKLARSIALFALALLLLHLAYGLLCLGLARLSSLAWPSAKTRLNHHVFLWFLALTVWLLASNAARFPRSSLGSPYADVMRTSWAGHSPATWIGMALVLAVAGTVVAAGRKFLSNSSREARMRATAITIVFLTGAAIALPVSMHTSAARAAPPAKPNVILIGLDSLRHDIVAPETSPHVMPKLEAFLAQSVSFSNATTPLARTFPSWVSILTGRHPHTTGAVVNLLPRDLVHEGPTLGTLLKGVGYGTAYAIDDVRFSNIDESYGFDRRVTPPIGASEFVIGFFADTPLSNMVLNTTIGGLLFPHAYANRAIANTYDPDSFVRRVEREIPYDGPLFLAVHLTLPHWPYTWAGSPPTSSQERPYKRWPDYYINAARRADQQFGELVEDLRKRGALDNAIVVVLSDHGETFGDQEDSLVPMDSSEIVSLHAKPIWGHGTSVFSPEQYRVVLAMRGFGSAALTYHRSRVSNVPVSVEDIAPTVLEQLGLKEGTSFDGYSLVDLLRDQPDTEAKFSNRIRFTETEFNPGLIATQAGKISASAVAAAATYYHVNPTTDRIELKSVYVPHVLNARQYAALGDQFLVSAIPDPVGGTFRYFAVDQHGGAPQPLTDESAATAPAEVSRLWKALRAEFSPVLTPSSTTTLSRSPRDVAHAPPGAGP